MTQSPETEDAASAAPAAAATPAEDKAKALQESRLAAQFARAVAGFGAQAKSTLRDIRDAFSERREDLIGLQEKLNDALRERDRVQDDLVKAYIFCLIPPVGIPLAIYFHSQARRQDREIARMVDKVDIEVTNWKITAPAAPKP